MSATSARNLVDWLAVRGLTLVPLARSNQRDKHVVLTTNGFRTRVQFPPGPPSKRNGLPGRVSRFVLGLEFAGIEPAATRGERGFRAACGEPASAFAPASAKAGEDAQFPPGPPSNDKGRLRAAFVFCGRYSFMMLTTG